MGNKNLRGPAITCIGGGTGLSTLLRGLKKVTHNVTAIVAVSDDGGGSGVLREQLRMPPPGDIRNCMQALSNAEPTIEMLMAYRFDSGDLSGQSFGNLFLAAINGISESFDKAVIRMGEVLSITGRVLPVTTQDIHLRAEFEDGSMVVGESTIPVAKTERSSRIKRVELVPEAVKALPACIEAIEEAEMIILGPGSLYTSIIPNLLVDGVAEAIMNSDAVKLYVCNVMTQPGETDGYSVSEHISEIFEHGGGRLFDQCLTSSDKPNQAILDRYFQKGAETVCVDSEAVNALGVAVLSESITAGNQNLARHDPDKLANEVMRIFNERAPTRQYGS
ncbi:MAG: YvcK family protein [Oscillospiraceae bacterium]|nr:YvcK family protein [Oscillospiraceae bacterium]